MLALTCTEVQFNFKSPLLFLLGLHVGRFDIKSFVGSNPLNEYDSLFVHLFLIIMNSPSFSSLHLFIKLH